MKRTLHAVVVLKLVLASGVDAQQWTTVNTDDIQNANVGKVGIGVAPWRAKLDVQDSSAAVWAQSDSTAGVRAIMGYAAGASGKNIGVYGWAESSIGVGVLGKAGATSGANYGVWGQTSSPSGVAIAARTYTDTGGTALLAISQSADGYAVYSTGGRNYFGGNVGFGTANPTAMLHSVGAVRLQSLPAVADPTTARPLVADGSGNVSRGAFVAYRGAQEFPAATTAYAFTVPIDVAQIRFRAWGAGGGGTNLHSGGSGAYVDVPVWVTSGETLTIEVGLGGTGGSDAPPAWAGSGGPTRLLRGTTLLASAGGGGGAGPDDPPCTYGPCPPLDGSGGMATGAAGLRRDGFRGQPGVFMPPPFQGAVAALIPPGLPLSVGTGGASTPNGSTGGPGLPGAALIEW